MAYKYFVAALFTLLIGRQYASAQAYQRSSLTIFFTAYSDDMPISNSIYSNTYFPEKFDRNDIGTNIISLNASFNQADFSSTNTEISDKITALKIPNKILRSILIDENARCMTVSKLEERGLYNASDADYLIAKNSARQLSVLKDQGIKLLQNVYFLIIKPDGLSSQKDDKNTKVTAYTFSGSALLYKLDLDSAYLSNQFWTDFYFDKPNETMLKKLMEYRFPIKQISNTPFAVYNTDMDALAKTGALLSLLGNSLSGDKSGVDESKITYKSKSKIHQELADKAVKASIASLAASYTQFTLKQSIFLAHPIKAKIGRKEGVHHDDLFVVSENVMNTKTGAVTERKVGYIRAKRIASNGYSKGVTKPSVFYKAPSGKIRKGMSIKEEPESGITIGASYNLTNTCLLGGAYLNVEYITHWIRGLRLGLDAGYNFSATTASVDGNKYNNFSGQGLTGIFSFKESINFNYVSILPMAGIYYSYLPLTESTLSTDVATDYPNLTVMDLGAVLGCDIAINLGKTFQLHGGYRYAYSLADPVVKSDNGFPYQLNFDKSTISLGIRFIGF